VPVERSKKYFHGLEGYNCAQAIAAAFCNHYGDSTNLICQMKQCGGGQAKDGICGALFAAEIIAADQNKKNSLRIKFLQEVGAITCREIKRETGTSCIRCIETAARFLNEELNM